MLRLARYQSWEELQELREHWNPLLSGSSSDTVFLTWEWCSAWWKNYGAGRQLFVLAAWEGNELVGVAPFFLAESRSFGQSWKCLHLIGDGSNDSDYLDCFAQYGREAEVISIFMGFLESHRASWDWLDLNGGRRDSPTLVAILDCARERRWRIKSDIARCATLELPRSWDEFLSQLEPRFRTKVRSSLTSMQQCVRATPVECRSKEDIEAWLPHFFDLHTSRWRTKNKPGVFRDPLKQAFYRDLSEVALQQGWLAFHRLNWGERALAFQYGLLYKNRFHLLQEAYDPAFANIRPGVALRAWLMRYWIEVGLEQYDFLAGLARYKLDWGASEKITLRVRLAAKPAGMVTALEWPQIRAQARDRIERLAPKVLVRARGRLLSWLAQDQWQSGNGHNEAKHTPFGGSVVRWLASRTYSCSPVAALGRSVANRYSWAGSATSAFLPLQRRSKPVCQIFLYHRVNDDNDPFLSGLPVCNFAAQMEHIARNFPIVTLDQVCRGEFPGGHSYYVAVTFDDGYRDNFLCAFPILKKFSIPATVFLATGSIDSGELPWYDQVRLAFKLTARCTLLMTDLGGPRGCLEQQSSRLRLLERTLAWLRGMAQPARLQATTVLFSRLGVPSPLNLPHQMLRWEEIRQMNKSNIDFGAHTISHPTLSQVSGPDMKREILGSKETIEDRLQLSVLHFAYPFGQPSDFSAQVKRAVQDAGFKTAVTTIWGLNRPDHDRFELRRFSPWELDSALFRMKMDWYRFREFVAPETANTDTVNESVMRMKES